LPEEPSNHIGIGQIKSVLQKLQLSPVQGNLKAVIIYEIQQATPEAQNALLKCIEEPGENVVIIATAHDVRSVLPTIISRCKVVILKTKQEQTDPSIEKDALLLLGASDAEKFLIAEQYSSKILGITLLTELIRLLRKKTVTAAYANKPVSQHLINQIRMLERALQTIKTTNVSSRLLLENVLFELGI
jgi:DNA polymerase III delta prime subunit